MINVSELRIGNWVNAKFMSDDVNFQVKEVYKGGAALYKTNVKCHTSTLHPIPLNEEILRKFGFDNQRHEEWDTFAYKDTPICSYFDGVEWCFKYGYDSDLVFTSAIYVHQLQNLMFALTHTELQINL